MNIDEHHVNNFRSPFNQQQHSAATQRSSYILPLYRLSHTGIFVIKAIKELLTKLYGFVRARKLHSRVTKRGNYGAGAYCRLALYWLLIEGTSLDHSATIEGHRNTCEGRFGEHEVGLV